MLSYTSERGSTLDLSVRICYGNRPAATIERGDANLSADVFRAHPLPDRVVRRDRAAHGPALPASHDPGGGGNGRVFVRTDKNGYEVAASLENVGKANYATCLVREGVRVSTAEHLLAALYAPGVDNVRLELDAEEVPIMDGSAAPFVALVREAGIVDQQAVRTYITMVRPLTLVERHSDLDSPAAGFRVTYQST